MGGFLILLAMLLSTLLWADLANGYVWIVADGHPGLWADRLRRRFHQGAPAQLQCAARPGQAAARDRHRAGRRLAYHAKQGDGSASRSRCPSSRTSWCSSARLSGDRGLRHGRRLQRRQPDRRARRPGDRPGDDRRRRVRPDLPTWSATPSSPTTCRSTTSPGSGELAVVLRRAGRRRARFPVVQRAAGDGVHGRHRIAGAGRRASARSAW